ncbi:hypothetical protein [Dietzia cinnamea]|nr:hypothetical protein [Dietzia cinnamea]
MGMGGGDERRKVNALQNKTQELTDAEKRRLDNAVREGQDADS